MLNGQALGEQIVAQVREFFGRAVSPVLERVEKLETREPIAGKDGRDGIDGKDGEPGKDGVNGKDGRDGTDSHPAMVKAMIDEAIAAIPPAQDGTNGRDGVDGRDGQDIHPDTVKSMLMELVSKAVSELPKAENGSPGRDATQIDYRDGIDESKSYPRGTHALYRGGVIVALRATDAFTDDFLKAGWGVAQNGVHSEVEEVLDDGRTIRRTTEYTTGHISTREHKTAAMIDRKVWKPETVYERGDVVTWGGSGFIAQCETTTKPETNEAKSDWRLLAKRGNNARSAYDIAVSNGFKGSEKDWLASLRGPKGDPGGK